MIERRDSPAPGALEEAALAVAAQATRAGIGAGIPTYNEERDNSIRSLPSFRDLERSLSRLRRIRSLYGPDASERLALAWIYSVARLPSADAAWRRFWPVLLEPEWFYFAVANLEHFQTDAEQLQFDDGLTIRARRFDALSDLLGWDEETIAATLGADWQESFGGAGSHAVIAAERVPKTPDNLLLGIGTALPRVQRLLLALRLAQPGDVGIGSLFFGRRDLNLIGGISRTIRQTTRIGGEPYHLTEGGADNVRDLHRRLVKFETTQASHYTNIQTALGRFTSTFDRPLGSAADRLIDDVVALEAIVGTRDELAFTIAFRVSGMLESEDGRRLSLFRRLKSFYATRSDLLHGANLGARALGDIGREAELRDVVRRLLRGLLGLIGTDLDPTPGLIKERLDEQLLDPERRERLTQRISPVGTQRRPV